MKHFMKALAFFAFLFLTGILNAEEQQTIKHPNLKKQVVVRTDEYGVPHIKAENLSDLYFVQGFLTAKDRLFEMDYFRRRAYGKMAEIEGEEEIESDYNTRKIGFEKMAKKIYALSRKDLQQALTAYADGVNAYIASLNGGLPEEFKKLNYAPEPWQPYDGLAFGRVMSYRLSESLGEEIGLWLMRMVLGKDRFHEILDGLPADPVTIVSENNQTSMIPESFSEEALAWLLDEKQMKASLGLDDFVGSNNWVVGGKKTTTGFPVLCNDPHLGINNPSIWHEVHLQAPGLNVIGATFPGTPGVIIGHNENIAWGVTTTGYDVSDVYIEKLNPKNPNEYQFKGKFVPFTEEKTLIKYRTPEGMKEKEMTIKFTKHGPVVRENISMLPNKAFSFKWTGFEPTFEIEAFAKINQAKNLKEFKNALKSFGVGAQNFVYADTKGNIFFMAPSKVPIRPKNTLGYIPQDGTGNSEWQGFIPYEKLPQVENPKEGFIVTANNRPAPKNYPYYIGVLFDIGYRAKRITTRIEEKEKLSFEDVQSIQGDHVALPGKDLTPFILEAAERNSEKFKKFADPVSALSGWDFACSVDSVACSIFFKWLKHMSLRALMDEVPPGEMADRMKGELVGRAEVIEILLLQSKRGNLKYDWFDDKKTKDVKETLDDIVYLALEDAVNELVKQFGENMDGWTWGKLHQLNVNHLMISERNLGPFPRWGAEHTVDNAGFGLLGEKFNFGGGPSLRMCSDVQGKLDHAENVLPGGQSSDPKSPHYDDQLKLWLENKAHPMFFSEEDVAEHTESTFTFSH